MFKKAVFLLILFFSFNAGASEYGTVFSEEATMAERWKQVYILAKSMSRPEANTFLSKCINSNTWFLQLAALKSYDVLMPKAGLIKARRLLKDSPSLVVRSESVHFIKKHGGIKDVSLLFDALLSSKNFKGRRSLSIRPQIIQAIESMDVQNIYKKRWQRLKHDSNEKVRNVARFRSNPNML
jgi:hypothetical protein